MTTIDRWLPVTTIDRWLPLTVTTIDRWLPLTVTTIDRWLPLTVTTMDRWLPITVTIIDRWLPITVTIIDRCMAASNSGHYRLVPLYKEMHSYDVPSSSAGLSALVVVMAAATSASVMGVLSVLPLGSN